MKHSRWPVFSFRIISTLLFSLWLFADVLFVHADQCLASLSTPGWTVPAGDIALREGETLNITCYLDPLMAKAKNYSSSDLFFTQNTERISSEYVSRLNDTAIRLVMSNLTSLNDWFYCKLITEEPLNNKVETSSLEIRSPATMNETVVCMNVVAVGGKPKDIENYSCVSYDWKELNCTWTVPNNTVKTTYTIFYMTPRRGGRGQKYPCPKENDEIVTNTCVWKDNSSPPYRHTYEYIQIIFVGNNTFGENNQSYKFHNYAHIIPKAPRQLVAFENTTSSIYLRWNIDHLIIFEKGWIYNVSYLRSSADGWNSTVYNHKDLYKDKAANVFLNVTGLKYPNTLYDFRVKMKSAVASGDQDWSEPATLVVKTKPCPPYKSPRTDIGSFEIVPQEVGRAERHVFIYWQPLQALEYNGDDFRYDIVVFEEDKEITAKPIVLKYSYAKYKISFRSHKFLIYSVNKEGRAEQSSVINVPRKDETIRTPAILTKIDYGNGLYELSWKPSEVSRVTNYTAFWCESVKEYPYQCDGYIDWISVPSNVSKYNFTVNTSKVYQFAVSANVDTGSSGMIWATCTVVPDRVNKIKNVWVDKWGSYFIFIRWKLECSERIDALKGYYIYYCVVESPKSANCSSPMKNVTIYGDLDTDQGNVTELEPYTYYRMSMAMFTSNSTGPKSDSVVQRTRDGKPDVSKLQIENTGVTNTSISLAWTAPNVTNGVLQRYLVTYNQKEATLNASETQITLTNLTSYETYHIKIQACTFICSDPFGPMSVTTKVGKPGLVVIKNPQNINASHVGITWARPDIPGGPHPEYRVRIRYHGDSHKSDEVRQMAENSTLVDLTSCSSGTFTVQVRAENKDTKSGKIFEGEWSNEIYNTCSNGSTMSPFLKLMLIFAGVLIIFSFFASWGRKGMYKCQQMKKVEVTLPTEFTVPPLFSGESKECEIYEDFGMQPSKSVEEFYLVDKTTTELSLFSSQP